jgi:hypothetical protein
MFALKIEPKKTFAEKMSEMISKAAVSAVSAAFERARQTPKV